MKFFKHFVDAQRGKALRGVRRSLGMAGIGMYWSLVEICAEKLDKKADEEFTKEHCVFEFDLGVLSECLGVKPARVQVILNSFSEHSLLRASSDNFIIKIEMPKLLESLDRDAKRARTERATAAPKIKSKKEDQEQDLNIRNEKNIFNILDKTELQHVLLSRASEIQQVTEILKNEHVFADRFPTIVKNNTQAFCAAVLKAYNFEINDFKTDINSIINEKFTDEKSGAAKADYIAARIRNKALELYNAAG